MANIAATTTRRSKRSDRYPVKGVTSTLGAMAAKVTTPTQTEDSVSAQTSQPRAMMRAQAAAPADMLAVHSVR